MFSEFIAPEFQRVFQTQSDTFDEEAVLYSAAVFQMVSGTYRLMKVSHTRSE